MKGREKPFPCNKRIRAKAETAETEREREKLELLLLLQSLLLPHPFLRPIIVKMGFGKQSENGGGEDKMGSTDKRKMGRERD